MVYMLHDRSNSANRKPYITRELPPTFDRPKFLSIKSDTNW